MKKNEISKIKLEKGVSAGAHPQIEPKLNPASYTQDAGAQARAFGDRGRVKQAQFKLSGRKSVRKGVRIELRRSALSGSLVGIIKG